MTKIHAIAATVAAIVAAAATSPAFAITDTNFTYSSAKTSYVGVPVVDFSPDNYFTASKEWSIGWLQNGLRGDGCFNTGVNLPQGVAITQTRVVYEKHVYFSLFATNRDTGGYLLLSNGNLTSSSDGRIGKTVPLDTPHVVDNAKYNYGMGVCIAPGDAFHGGRLTFTYTSAGS